MDKKTKIKVDNLIVSYFGGQASKHEIQWLEDWVSESDDNLTYFKQIRNLWEITGELPITTEKALINVIKQIDTPSKDLTLWNFWQKIAAVLLIPLLVSTIWISFGRKSEICDSKPIYRKAFSTIGTYSRIELSDGSKVWLNAGSSLEYPDRFISSSRNVYLEGEAYFEVQSNTESPFFVHTHSVSIKATGTRFNVMAFKNSTTPAITLIEGKVAILKIAKNKKDSLITSLLPQQHLQYDISTGQVSIQYEDTYKYIAWKDGKLVFRNDKLVDVVKRIGNLYNVDIEIVGEKIKQYRYRATFENEPLSELLRLLKISSPIDYREIKPKLQPDSSFSRRKIIIYSASN